LYRNTLSTSAPPPRDRPPTLLDRLLEHPRLILVLALLGGLLVSPSLFAGIGADDWLHRLHLDPEAPYHPPTPYGPLLGAFEFFPADRVEFRKLLDEGVLPWWVGSEVSGVFFRPLTVLTHGWDWRVFGERLWLHHAHSILWFLLTIWAASRFFVQWLGPGRAAALALLLFVVDESHALPAGWLANRNAMLALFFSLLAATSHLRDLANVAHARWWTPLWVGAALLSAEAGATALLALMVFEASYVRPLVERVRSWLPILVVTAGWAAVWKGLGFGVQGSGLYVDPLRETGWFLVLLPERLGALSAAAWFNLPVDGWMMWTPKLGWGLGVGLLGLCLGLVFRLTRGSADPRAYTAALLAFLPLLPPLGAFPMTRLVGVAGVGVAALLALLWTGPAPSRLVVWLGRWHLYGAAFLLFVQSVGLHWMLKTNNAMSELVPDAPPETEQHLVVLHGFEIATAFTSMVRVFAGKNRPDSVLLLAPLATPIRLTRLDARRLRVEAPEGAFRVPGERLCRSSAFVVGEVSRSGVATVTVQEVDDAGGPRVWEVEFLLELEDERMIWRRIEGFEGREWTPPAVGATVEVPAPLDLPWT